MRVKKFFIGFLMACLFFSCDSEKARQNKAEKLITKTLFEKLADYKSYENISIQIDTLEYPLLSDKNAFELANELYELNQDIFLANSELENSQSELTRLKNRIAQRFWSNSMDIFQMANAGNQMDNLEKKIKRVQTNLDGLNENKGSLIQKFGELNSKYNSIELYGWLISHKYRAKDELGNFQLFNHVYIMDKDLSEILYDYDEDNDAESIIMVSIIKNRVIYSTVRIISRIIFRIVMNND